MIPNDCTMGSNVPETNLFCVEWWLCLHSMRHPQPHTRAETWSDEWMDACLSTHSSFAASKTFVSESPLAQKVVKEGLAKGRERERARERGSGSELAGELASERASEPAQGRWSERSTPTRTAPSRSAGTSTRTAGCGQPHDRSTVRPISCATSLLRCGMSFSGRSA